MTAFPLLAVGFAMKIVAIIFVICALLLVLIVLVQKGKGGGLSSAFGGASGAGGLMGSKTGDFLTWFTISLVGLFLILAVVMAKWYKPTTGDFGAQPTPPPTAATATDNTPDTTPYTTTDTNSPGN